jgi:Zn ribbon nucleic-acid-binding protein
VNVNKFIAVSRKYKKCPQCGASWKSDKITTELEDEIITIKCECGFIKHVDENNNEISN